MKALTIILISFLFNISTCVQVGKTYHLSVEKAFLYDQPNTNAKTLEKLEQYDNVVLLEAIDKEWSKVQFNGLTGFLQHHYLKPGKAVVTISLVRTGAICRDGSRSYATGRGACSHHGGVKEWVLEEKQSVEIINNNTP